MNPSKRKAKAIFLIHIGNGFLVDSYGIRLDSIEPPIFGVDSPEAFILEQCHNLIREIDPDENAYYKTFKIELEVSNIKYVPQLNSANALIRLKEKRQSLWQKRADEKAFQRINPSVRK